jgi:hypothetical protein
MKTPQFASDGNIVCIVYQPVTKDHN